jgi:hypothetical protein
MKVIAEPRTVAARTRRGRRRVWVVAALPAVGGRGSVPDEVGLEALRDPAQGHPRLIGSEACEV